MANATTTRIAFLRDPLSIPMPAPNGTNKRILRLVSSIRSNDERGAKPSLDRSHEPSPDGTTPDVSWRGVSVAEITRPNPTRMSQAIELRVASMRPKGRLAARPNTIATTKPGNNHGRMLNRPI
jgi:hypothetical protein